MSDPAAPPAPPAEGEPDPEVTEPPAAPVGDEWKARSRQWEKEAKAAKAELDKIRAANMTETERAVELAREEGRKAALSEVTDRLISAEIRTAATGKLADPTDAEPMLRAAGLNDALVDKDGNADPKAIAAALERLLKMKPHLAVAAPGRPLPGGAKKPPAGVSINDSIRQAAGRS